MSNPFDALRKVINHEANQDDDGGFFARLYGFQPEHDDEGPTVRGLFQHWDAERDGPAFKWPPQDNGGKLPAGLDYFHNLLSPPGPFMRLLKRKRQRTCKVWKPKTATSISRIEGTFDHTWRTNPWEWRCQVCNYRGSQPSWKLAYESATHHARNHH